MVFLTFVFPAIILNFFYAIASKFKKFIQYIFEGYIIIILFSKIKNRSLYLLD